MARGSHYTSWALGNDVIFDTDRRQLPPPTPASQIVGAAGSSGPSSFLVPGDTGAFVVAGNTADILVRWRILGGTGAYALTGNAGAIHLIFRLAGGTGAFTETGSAGVVRLLWKILGGTGAYTETGGSAVAKLLLRLLGGTGAYTETGGDGQFKLVTGSGFAQYYLFGDVGSFAVTGGDGLFQLVTATPTRPEAEGGISGYLKREKGYSRLGGNVMVQTMGEATERAEKIMLGWRDEEEALFVIQIIQNFYD